MRYKCRSLKIINRDPLNTPTYSNYSYYALAAGNLPVAEEMIGKVFELLQKAPSDRDPALTEMQLSWAMTSLRDNPRWAKIVEMMGLTS